MKKLTYYTPIIFLLLFVSCTKNFDDLNRDPTKLNSGNIDPNYLLTSGQLEYGNMTEHQLYLIGPMVQILSSTVDYYGGGDKYNRFLYAYNERFFTDGQRMAAKFLEAKTLAEDKNAADNINLIQICRIMRVLSMQRITDIYGDIPYFQDRNGVQQPKYDRQEDIYKDMLTTLDDAASKFDVNVQKATGDLFYDGDINRWKKFTYSLMLRVAMRLTKADPAMARLYAEKTAGKTFSDFTENAILKLDGGSGAATQNKASNALFADLPQVRWSKAFIDFLRDTDDPRLYVITEKADTGLANNDNLEKGGFTYTKTFPAPAGSVYEVPKGMPNGYDMSGAKGIATSPNYPGPTGTGANASPLGNYARPKQAVFVKKKDLPVFIITYAETELLLAEATARGWNVGTLSAREHYKNAVISAMRSLEQLSGLLTMGTEVQAYADQHPLDDSSLEKSLKMINSQYWVASLFDFPETWANYRRSGYPELVPVTYPGNETNGTIPRRLTYPGSETSNNQTNYLDAIKRLGGTDKITLRVWWDK